MKKYKLTILPLFIISWLISSCNNTNEKIKPFFELIPPARSGIYFNNELKPSRMLNITTHEVFYNGSGVGIGDFNDDGLQDIFLASNMSGSHLYLNKGNFQFQDITQESGIRTEKKWVNGVALIDINNDGSLDIYLSCGGPYADSGQRANELWINNNDGTFTEEAKRYGIADTGFSTQSAFFDYNRDGLIDLYILENGIGSYPPNYIHPKIKNGKALNTDQLYKNNGDGTFTNVSNEAGIRIEGNGLGIAICDINKDGFPDVYVANDYLSNDLFYVNNRDGTFTDKAGIYFGHQSYAAMGTDIADINDDGLMDVMTLDMRPSDNQQLKRMYGSTGYSRYYSELSAGYAPQFSRNTLQLNMGFTREGDPIFSEIGQLAGVSSTNWSWSALFGDFNNDGWKDLFVTNGIPRNVKDRDFAEYKYELLRDKNVTNVLSILWEKSKYMMVSSIHNCIFKNNGDLTFIDKSTEWGLVRPSFSTGAAYADFNNDGTIDIIINNINNNAFLYKNNKIIKNHSYLKVKLNGPPKNRMGLGTSLILFNDSQKQYIYYSVYRGYKSSMATPIHFGFIDTTNTVDSLIVIWPDSNKQVLRHLKTNRIITVDYKKSNKVKQSRYANSFKAFPIFKNVTQERSINFKHIEPNFNEFKRQPLLPHKFSLYGPGIAVGDVNNDGLEDFFIGGGSNQSGRIFIQKENGTFKGHDLDIDSNFENDMGAVFFYANNDNNLDLYVTSGGGEFYPVSKNYQDRLYYGNGKGEFHLAVNALPQNTTSTSVVVASDFDKDGDFDLFVGGRVIPTQYPKKPNSYLLINNGDGTFVDVTDSVIPDLRNIGMVTDAIWSDFNNDSWFDLILVGEWMPITVFRNKKGHFVNMTDSLGLSKTRGWWNSIIGNDFNKDGYVDYVAGNLGLNTSLKNKPGGNVKIIFDDFDNNGQVDPVISIVINNTRYPIALRGDMNRQLPAMRERFPTYKSYSKATLIDLFSRSQLKRAKSYTSNVFRTSYIENKEGKSFKLHSFPIQAQFAPVYGMVSGYFNCDSERDILMIGNSFAPNVFRGQYDAINGLLFIGNGKGGFTPLSIQRSGFYVDGDGKALAKIKGAHGRDLILAARNNGNLEVFERSIPCQNRCIPK